MQLFRVAFALFVLLCSPAIHAQGAAWPDKPIRWIAPYLPDALAA